MAGASPVCLLPNSQHQNVPVLKLLSRITFPALLFFVLTGIRVGASTLYQGRRVDEPPLFSLLAIVSWYWVIGWWLTDDLSRRRERWIYCPGVFVPSWAFWLPYYLLKTRGRKALVTIAVFVAVAIAAALLGTVIGAVLLTVLS